MHRSILKWHRYLGVVIALTVVVVAVTGICLNHTGALTLDKRFITNKWVLNAYGAQAPKSWAGYNVDQEAWTLQIGNQLFLNDSPLGHTESTLVGAVYHGEYYLLATQAQVFLFDQKLQLIEEMSELQGIDGRVLKIGSDSQGRVCLALAENRYLVADELISSWLPVVPESVVWSVEQPLPETLLGSLERFWFGEGVSLERLMLDLHSGRVFSQVGVVLLDLAGVGMILLAFTGVWMWARRVARQRR